ncbi:MAG TPA: TetR/AcrR family transcriptional regulator [Mycobacteriales bacterium]|nr:TetR/AcrR family transcriptional regulator [Mycobacteriales bacterium]
MARSAAAPRRRNGLKRGSLTPELIVSESLRLLDTEGVSGFSLPKLGRALGADQTAVYRHFASKDDLMLAIADRLIEESTANLTEHDCWVETLADVARQLRATYLAHPAAASLSACRTTRRPAEMRAIDTIIGAVLGAGFKGAAAARMYRAFGDFNLAWSGGEATFLSLDPAIQRFDRSAWTQAYLEVGQQDYPNTWRIRTALPDVGDDEIFESILGLVLGGMLAVAPEPCACKRHSIDAPGRVRASA